MKHVNGNLWIETKEDAEQYSDVETVGGDLHVEADFTAPAITSVGRDLWVNADFTARAITSVGRDLWVNADFTARAITSVGRDLWVNADFTAPAITSVGRDLWVKADFTAPALTSVGGDLWGNADFTAPNLPYCPDGELTGWKKCRDDIIVKLRIPKRARRVGLATGKCRASCAIVEEIIGATEAVSQYDNTLIYRVGETVKPDKFDKSFNTCSKGIHFFLTRELAEAY